MGGRTAVRPLDKEPENAPAGGQRAQSESECRGWCAAATLVSRFRSRRDRRRQRAALPSLVAIAKTIHYQAAARHWISNRNALVLLDWA